MIGSRMGLRFILGFRFETNLWSKPTSAVGETKRIANAVALDVKVVMTGTFQPGDRVRVIDGTFAGSVGTIVDPATCRDADGQRLRDQRGTGVWVLLTIFDRPMPVVLGHDQIEVE